MSSRSSSAAGKPSQVPRLPLWYHKSAGRTRDERSLNESDLQDLIYTNQCCYKMDREERCLEPVLKVKHCYHHKEPEKLGFQTVEDDSRIYQSREEENGDALKETFDVEAQGLEGKQLDRATEDVIDESGDHNHMFDDINDLNEAIAKWNKQVCTRLYPDVCPRPLGHLPKYPQHVQRGILDQDCIVSHQFTSFYLIH